MAGRLHQAQGREPARREERSRSPRAAWYCVPRRSSSPTRCRGFATLLRSPTLFPSPASRLKSVAPPRYRSTFDIIALVESAKEELATEQPELFKIFLLGAMAGLRRHEIDLLQWRAFLFDEGAIRIETRSTSGRSHFDRRRHPRRWRAARCLSRLPGAGEE